MYMCVCVCVCVFVCACVRIQNLKTLALSLVDAELNVCLFDLIVYVPSAIFQLNRDGYCWVEPYKASINVSCSRTTMQ